MHAALAEVTDPIADPDPGPGTGPRPRRARTRRSRSHAEIHQLAGGFKLVDKGSLAGTWVNGERVVEYGPARGNGRSHHRRLPIARARRWRMPCAARRRRARNSRTARASAQRVLSTRTRRRLARQERQQWRAGRRKPALRAAQRAGGIRQPPRPVPAATDRDLERYLAGFEWRRKLHRMLLEASSSLARRAALATLCCATATRGSSTATGCRGSRPAASASRSARSTRRRSSTRARASGRWLRRESFRGHSRRTQNASVRSRCATSSTTRVSG